MSKLLIVESPGKIKKIQEYLGNNYIVMASVGHIIDLDSKTMSIDTTTFEPYYYQYPDKIDVIKKLKSGVIKVGKNNVYLAADEDREGEMIAWSLARELNISNEKRIVFNSITEKELKNAVANPKKIDTNLVYAQQARRILDRFAGYLISPLLNKNGFKGAQSAGRVQSVVVKIIVDKEREIEEFYKQKKSTYFYVTCLIKFSEYEILTKLTKIDENINLSENNFDDFDTENDNISEKKNKKNSKQKINLDNTISNKSYAIFDKNQEEFVITIIKAMIKGNYSILNLIEKIKKVNAPAPFTTSTLQQYASQRFHLDAKKTMSIAQKLYEGGHITYMRTDSTCISDEAITSIKDTIKDNFGESYFERHLFINKKANTQEAHECIRPTKPNYSDIEGSSDEKKLYNAIWKRTIQSQMKAAEYQHFILEIFIKDKKNILKSYKLVGTLENLIYEGWLIVDGKKKSSSLNFDNIKDISWLEINAVEDTFKPPTRYNDASLINKMDPKNLNIGRPSTYASFIDKIIKRTYVEIKDLDGFNIDVINYNVVSTDSKTINKNSKSIVIGKEKKKLVPTILGRNITEFLELNFPLLMDYKFTANMEHNLDEIAEGNINKNTIINEFYKYLCEHISTIKTTVLDNIIFGFSEDGLEIKLLNGKFGKYFVCGDKKINLKYILSSDSHINESNIEEYKSEIVTLINQKLKDNNIYNSNNNNNNNIIGISDTGLEIKLLDGKFGKYFVCGDKNISLKYLLPSESEINENNINDHLQEIILLINKKLNENVTNTNNIKWTKGKTQFILKSGQYGYYIEEINSTGKKKNNWSMSFLINKIATNNSITDINKNIKLITEKISIEDIMNNIEFQKKNKNKNKK